VKSFIRNTSLLALFVLTCACASAEDKTKLVFLKDNGESRHIFMKQNEKVVQLTNGSETHLYPDISSNGDLVVFVKGPTVEKLSLYVKDLEKNETLQLGNLQGLVVQPRFARNGDHIYFSGPIARNGRNQIGFFDLKKIRENQTPEKIEGDVLYYDVEPTVIKTSSSQGQADSFNPSPTSDASLLAYHTSENEGQTRKLILRDMNSKEEEVLTDGMSASFSKDDRYIAFTREVAGNWDVYIYDRFNKTTVRATHNEALDFAPSFNQKGALLFASTRGEQEEFALYTIEAKDWKNSRDNAHVLYKKEGSQIYTGKISGLLNFKLQQKADITGPRRSSFGAVSHRGKIYVAGGHMGAEHTYPPESFSNIVRIYDMQTNIWNEAAPRLHKCHGFDLAAHGDYIYAFGGFAYDEKNNPKWKSLDVVERYSIKEDKWEVVAKMPRRRSSNVVEKVNGKMYLIGGWDSTPKFDGDYDGTFHSEIDVFDPEGLSFKTLEANLDVKRRALSSVSYDGQILLIGGISEGAKQFNLLDKVTAFDPKTQKFEEVGKLPYPTFAPAAGVMDDELYVFGGMFKTGEWSYEYVTHIHRMKFSDQKWENIARYLSQSKGFSQVVQMRSGLAVLGGHTYQDNQDAPVRTFELFQKL